MMVFEHVPVLLDELVDAISPQDGQIYVDCTLGGGGHTEALLQAADCRVIGLDRDPSALSECRSRLARFGDRFTGYRASFGDIRAVLEELEIRRVEGVFADIGVSSHQLDTASRGFSFRQAGPIDMRMDPDAPFSAAEIVNEWRVEELAACIWRFGEERRSRPIARAIVAGRPWTDTASLAAAVAAVVGRGNQRIHPATRTFQALRITVNDELGQLERLLPEAVDCLRLGGRLAVISFHSLEDRVVKQFMAAEAGKRSERDAWGNPIGPVRLSLSKPITPSKEDPNPRARSARLRVAVRLAWND
jgi:16S rRNA (cytosine1402-N4)-methyltransferase